jgi:serine protease Do
MALVMTMFRFCSYFITAALCSSASAYHTFDLKGGARVQGEIVVERPDAYYVDLGYDLIEIPKAAVEKLAEVISGEVASLPTMATKTLYSTSNNESDQPVRDWVDSLGEAVVLVQTPVGLGSGFIVNADGYIVTNDHVIAGENRLSVTVFEQGKSELKKYTYENVRIIATSSELDLALIKIDSDRTEPFDVVPIASMSRLREGQTVFAIGSPLGLDRTVSQGIISVADRVIGGRLYIQTTTQINPGNSGGPLFNLQGDVVGVNNMKIAAAGAEGLGFAISADILRYFLDNRDAYAFDPRNPNAGFRYMSPPTASERNRPTSK